MKKIVLAIGLLAFLTACQGNPAPTQTADETVSSPDGEPAVQWNGYTQISPLDIQGNPIRLISQEWMLITAGTESSYNTMTASWGALGEIWGKPISIITVRGSRYTHEFTESNDHYTLCFFDESYREKLQLLGTKSGRDTEKIAESGLTPVSTPAGSMAFSEARMILECRKLYSAPFEKERFDDPSIYDRVYGRGTDTTVHTQYIGEIVNVWIK